MKKKILISAIVAIITTLSSCEDFLEEANPNELTLSQFFLNFDDAESGIFAVYNQLRHPELVNLRIDPSRADVGIPIPPKREAAPTGIYYQRTYNSGDSDVTGKWGAMYRGIFRANQVLDGLNELAADTLNNALNASRWRRIRGEALFLRGLFHYWAYLTYNEGSVVISESVPLSNDDFNRSLSPADEVRNFFRNDFKQAARLLPETPFSSGRVSSNVAFAYLGQSHLYEAAYTNARGNSGDVNYDSALFYFDQVLESGNYQLVQYQPGGSLCTTLDEHNEESIFEINYDNAYKEGITSVYDNTSTWAALFATGGYDAFITAVPANWVIATFKNDPIDSTDTRNQILDQFSGDVRLRGNNGFSNANESSDHIIAVNLRLSHSIVIPEDEDTPYYGTKFASRALPFSRIGAFRKFANWDIGESELDENIAGRSGINHRLMRLADLYLMYAECLIKGGSDDAGVQEALIYINRIRQRSALQLLGASDEFAGAQYDGRAYSADDLMEHIITVERPLELCLEGYLLRQIDLRRWGIIKSRFEELSERQYYLNAPQYVFTAMDRNGNDSTATASNNIVQVGEHPTTPNSTLTEYSIPARNHIESIHNYYPIPISESGLNANIGEEDDDNE